MDMTTMMLIGIIPTTLIILGGLLVMRAGKEETAEDASCCTWSQ